MVEAQDQVVLTQVQFVRGCVIDALCARVMVVVEQSWPNRAPPPGAPDTVPSLLQFSRKTLLILGRAFWDAGPSCD